MVQTIGQAMRFPPNPISQQLGGFSFANPLGRIHFEQRTRTKEKIPICGFRARTKSGSDTKTFFANYWPNPGPGRLPFDSGTGDVAFASVSVSVASLTVRDVSECIFGNPVGIVF